jgi:hypothetical protein
VGLGVGGALAAAGWLGRRRPTARVLLGAATALLGLALGLLGLILVMLWAATNHKAAHANANILQLAPFAIALSGLGIGVARGRARAIRRAFLVAAAAAALSLLGLFVKVLPGTAQDNFAFVAMLLPLWLGMAFALRRLFAAARAPY